MTKKFVYQVASYEWVDIEAFGAGWRKAKAYAKKIHAPVYRLVFREDEPVQEVFMQGGCFLRVDLAKEKSIMVF